MFTINTEESAPANPTVKVGEPLHYGYVLPELVEKRRQIRPPLQPVCEKGDVMLRDVRTWHAGMPNESDNYRVMLALGYQVSPCRLLHGLGPHIHIFPAGIINQCDPSEADKGSRHIGTRTIPSESNCL